VQEENIAVVWDMKLSISIEIWSAESKFMNQGKEAFKWGLFDRPNILHPKTSA
jgi:hypothetical protein